MPVGVAARVCGCHRRLVRDRSWTPAMDRVRAAAHRTLGLALDYERRRNIVVPWLRCGLPSHLPHRSRDYPPSHPQRPATGRRARARPRWAQTRRRRSTRSADFAWRSQRCEGRRPMNQILDFVPIWTLILGFAVFFYVLLDGFDLGVGMLYGFAPDSRSRSMIMNSIAPIWDGNETWLVLGGLGLLAAFPLAFAVIIPAVYFPILVMLLALVFRGVAFEFRLRDSENRT